jgi:AraC family transcriptional regulator
MIVHPHSDTLPAGTRAALFDSGCRRDHTVALRHRAIERAISMMRERFWEELTLQDLAEEAQLSYFHFNRLFRNMTGISPIVFLASVRIENAKRLLLTTDNSITTICFDVGYISLGTFTSRFTSLVGLPPSHFRMLLQEEYMHLNPQDISAVLRRNTHKPSHNQKHGSVVGSVKIASPFKGLIFVGLFLDPLPQGQPVACTLLTEPGDYVIPNVPEGEYYLFATTMDESQNFVDFLTTGTTLYARQGRYPLEVHNGQTKKDVDLDLAPATWADPPMLIALPWLVLPHLTCLTS